MSMCVHVYICIFTYIGALRLSVAWVVVLAVSSLLIRHTPLAAAMRVGRDESNGAVCIQDGIPKTLDLREVRR